eukprot:2519582-Pleurochrysis_carterae.AAC.1
MHARCSCALALQLRSRLSTALSACASTRWTSPLVFAQSARHPRCCSLSLRPGAGFPHSALHLYRQRH